jgi:WD40 repeat protein/Ca2+-binding EF-hand superfamily protein
MSGKKEGKEIGEDDNTVVDEPSNENSNVKNTVEHDNKTPKKPQNLTIDASMQQLPTTPLSPLSPLESQSPTTVSKLLHHERPLSPSFRYDSSSDEEDEIAPKEKSGMDIMMSLEGSALNELRAQFEKKEQEEGDGLDLPEFVETFLQFLKPSKATRKYLVTDLVELFHQIDINGDGTCEWEEFTSYCVEAGLLATRRVKIPLKYQYVQDKRLGNIEGSKGELSGVVWLPEIQRLAVRSVGSHTLQMYNSDFVLRGVVDLKVGLERLLAEANEEEGHQLKDPDSIEASVLACCYVARQNLLIMATSDLAITMWEVGIQAKNPFIHQSTIVKPDEYRFAGIIQTKAMVLTLKYCPHIDMVWAVGGHDVLHSQSKHGGSDDDDDINQNQQPGIIQGYELRLIPSPGTKENWELVPHVRLDGFHKACTMDILEIPSDGVLITASIDKKRNLGVWDMQTGKLKSKLVGHKRGVVSLAFADEYKLLLSAGFEYDALIWDVKGSKYPIMTIHGHHAPLIGIRVVPFASGTRAITADRKGVFRMWDIRRSTHTKALQLESWEDTTEVGGFKPKSYDIMTPGRDCVTSGYSMHVFRCRRKRATEAIPSIVIYNDEFMQFAVAYDSDVILYSATTGKQTQHYRNIGKSAITSMCLDRRSRKLIIGYHGGNILVHNFMNGAVMKKFVGHSNDVTALQFAGPDDCLISTSWDKSICVFDELAPGEGLQHPPSGPILRSVTDIHKRDVGCMAFSHSLNLIATAATDFIVRIWDFQHLKMEKYGNCVHHKAEITSLIFIEPYPILASADCVGKICIWAVRPAQSRGRLLFSFENMGIVNTFVSAKKMEKILKKEEQKRFAFLTGMEVPENDDEDKEAELNDLQPIAINDMKLGTVDQDGSNVIIYTGDDLGCIKKWNLNEIIKHFDIQIPVKSVTQLNSYNARRRSFRSGKSDWFSDGKGKTKEGLITKGNGTSPLFARQSISSFDENSKCKATLVTSWKAHNEAINKIQVVNCRPFCVVSTSMDLSVRVWSHNGKKVGLLALSRIEKQRAGVGIPKPIEWDLIPPIKHKRHDRLRHGKAVLRDVDERAYKARELLRRMSLRAPLSSRLSLRPASPKIVSKASVKFEKLLNQMDGKNADSVILPTLKKARGPTYKHLKHEMVSRERDVQEAISRIEVNTALSPFLRQKLGDDWMSPEAKRAQKKKEERQLKIARENMEEDAIIKLSAKHKKDRLSKKEVIKEQQSTGKPIKLAKLESKKVQSAPNLLGLEDIFGADASSLLEDSSLPVLNSSIISSTPVQSTEVTEAIKVRKRIRMRKALTKANSMMAEAELMENDDHTDDDKERLRQVTSTIFGARAANEIPLGKSKKKKGSDPSSGRHKHVKHFGPYTVNDISAVRALFNSYDEDGSGEIDASEFISAANMQNTHLFENAGSMFASIDKDGSGTVNFVEMCEVLFPNLPDSTYKEMLEYVTADEKKNRKHRVVQLKDHQIEEIKQIFRLYDVDASGGITVDELYLALASSHGSGVEEFESYFSLQELRDLVLQYDDDGNETLEIEEFVALFHDNFYGDFNEEDNKNKDKDALYGGI